MKLEGKAVSRSEVCLTFDDLGAFAAVCGQHDENLRRLRTRTGVGLRVRGNQVFLRGSRKDVDVARSVLIQLYELARTGGPVELDDVDRVVAGLSSRSQDQVEELSPTRVVTGLPEINVRPRSANQLRYLEAMERNEIVFAVGPAGTGKTYLAMATAISWLLRKRVKHIVLTRPAVEAGERLGFLPGDLVQKVNPYLRPLYDALFDILGYDKGNRLLERGVIEIAPLAFMRGRTLSNCFVILDEAQNCSVEQMKMFLTRLGPNSRAVATGDITQSDLPGDRPSGVEHARMVLEGVEGIAICYLDENDVMRHPIVGTILKAYQSQERNAKDDRLGTGDERQERERPTDKS